MSGRRPCWGPKLEVGSAPDDRADFDRLAEIYAKDARWINKVDPNGPHCRNRDDIFSMFRQRMHSGVRITFDELRSPPPTSF